MFLLIEVLVYFVVVVICNYIMSLLFIFFVMNCILLWLVKNVGLWFFWNLLSFIVILLLRIGLLFYNVELKNRYSFF